MIELLVVLGALVALGLPVLLLELLGPWILAQLAVATVALGVVFGLPAGFVYHVQLRRALRAHLGAAPRYWWWNPTPHHRALPSDMKREFLPAFAAGAAGFLLVVLGGIAFVVCLVRVWLSS